MTLPWPPTRRSRRPTTVPTVDGSTCWMKVTPRASRSMPEEDARNIHRRGTGVARASRLFEIGSSATSRAKLPSVAAQLLEVLSD